MNKEFLCATLLLLPALAFGQSEACGPASIYPVIQVTAESSRNEANLVLEHALTKLGYAADAGRFKRDQQTCFVTAEWEDETLKVILYAESDARFTAQEFVDEALPALQAEILSSGFAAQMSATEEIALRD